MHRFGLVLLIGISVLLTACKGSKEVSNNEGKKSWNYALLESQKQKLEFSSLSITGKAKVVDSELGNKLSIGYRINMIADSLIWIRITKVVEGARILVREDSVSIIDRTKQTFQQGDFGPIDEFTGLETDLRLLQDLLIGNIHLIPALSDLKLTKKSSNPRLYTGSKAGTEFVYAIDRKNFRLVQLEAKNKPKRLHTIVNYKDFRLLGNTELAYKGSIKVLEPRPVSISFAHNRVQLNPKKISFRFNVPDHYERLEK